MIPFLKQFVVAATAVGTTLAVPAAEKSPASIISGYLDNDRHSITEDGQLPASNLPETLDFVRAVVADWETALAAIPAIRGDTRKQTLVVTAGEFLPPKEYLKFVGRLCDLRERDELTPNALRSVLVAAMPKEGFLAHNFDQPDIVPLLGRLEILVKKDFPGRWDGYFDELKSGKMKMNFAERVKNKECAPPEDMAEAEPPPYYRQLVGGDVATDMKLLARRPVEGITSLASENRVRSSMIVAISIIAAVGICVVLLVLRLIRGARKNQHENG